VFRLVYRPSRGWATIESLALAIWIALLLGPFGVLERNLAEAIILATPGGLLAVFIGLFLRGSVVWGVDEASVWRIVRDRERRIPLSEVVSVLAAIPRGSSKVTLLVSSADPKRAIDLTAGMAVSIDDLRAFYEAVAYHLQGHSSRVSNPFGWNAKKPEGEERTAAGQWFEPRDLLGHLAYALITGGLPLLSGASLGLPWLTVFGLLAIAAGLGTLIVARRLRRKEELSLLGFPRATGTSRPPHRRRSGP